MDWSRYWRSPDLRVEAMHAHFERHTYHRHSHETYSFGVTDDGAQSFTCRGAGHISSAGMVMAFNPDEAHDGRAADRLGFTYRIVHIDPGLVADAVGPLPLFADPVVDDPDLADRLRRLHRALLGEAPRLRSGELLDDAVQALARRAATTPPPSGCVSIFMGPPGLAGVTDSRRLSGRGAKAVAQRTRRMLEEDWRTDLTAEDLAVAAGTSRFVVYRAFREVHGMAPSDYQRQVRLRVARRLLASGRQIGEVAQETGFADQSHLTRWFARYYGITPGAYVRATDGGRHPHPDDPVRLAPPAGSGAVPGEVR